MCVSVCVCYFPGVRTIEKGYPAAEGPYAEIALRQSHFYFFYFCALCSVSMYVSCRNRKSGLYLLIRTITCLNFFEKLLIFKIHSFWRLKRDAGRSVGLVAVVESELEVREREIGGVLATL